MTNICMVTNGARPRLLEQCLRTLWANTPEDQFCLTLVDDGDNPSVRLAMRGYYGDKVALLRVLPRCRIIGALKNLGALWSEQHFGRGEWIMFCDDDLAFMPGWLDKFAYLETNLGEHELLGGCRHPYHGVNNKLTMTNGVSVEETDAVAGYCHFMCWSTWDEYGPYDATAKGTGQSEDFALCRKIVEDGGKVGYIYPPVMAHCGLTNSEGKPILGADLIEKVSGVLYE